MSLPTTADVIALGIAVAGSTAAAIVDLRTRRVPNALTMGMAAAIVDHVRDAFTGREADNPPDPQIH